MKKIFILCFVLVFSSVLSTTFAKSYDNCRQFFNGHKYHSAANCYFYKIQSNPNEPALRLWYAASLFYDRQLSQSLYQYEFVAENYKGTKFGEYAAVEAQKVLQKMQNVKNAKINDVGDYLNDLQKTFVWEKQPIKVWIQPSKYDNAIRKAFDEWQTKSYGIVKFNYYSAQKDGRLKVYFVDTLSCSEFKDALGCTSVYSYKGNKIWAAKIEILQRTESGQMCTDRQLYTVMLHEIGHALGMYGHSKNKNDIMYERDSAYDVHLSQKDINTLKTLYSK